MKRLQDIADQVGVSRTTVSNVLHGNTKKVSKEMIRKISEILNQEGYVPNTSSRELTRKGSCIIGLVLGYNCVHGIPSLRDTFVAELLSGVEETAHRNGYYIMLINGQDKNTDQVAEIASRWNVDGLVVLGLDEKKYKELRRQLNKYMVLIDTYPEAEYHYVNVGTDDFGGGAMIAKYLLDNGYTQAIFAAECDTGADHYRWKGFQHQMRSAGIDCGEERHILLPEDLSLRRVMYGHYLDCFVQAGAVALASDYDAAEVMNYLQDHGIQVPEQVSVTGFDDCIYAELMHPPLTTVRQNVPAKAEAAVEPSAAALFPEGQTFEDNAYTRYIESKLNVDLVDSFEAGGDAYTNQLATCVASGELPDILTVNSYDTFVEMVNNGLTYDLTDVYEEYASDYIKSLYDSYDGRCLGMATFDGRLMGIPGTNPDNSVPVLCWMRKDWLDKLGINPDPDGALCITLDDIAAVAKAFVDANVSGGNHTVGMAFSGNDIADAMCIANAMGGYIDRWIENPDGTMSWSTLAPEVKAAWAKMNEWYEEGILDPQFGTRTTEDINAMMINNELGIVFGAWHIPDWRLSSVKALVPEAEYIAYTVADDNGIVHTYHENAADRFLVVSKDCKYPQVAVEILNILYDDLARATAETAPDVIAYINAGGHNEGRPYYMEVLPSNNPSIYYTEHMAVINGEMTPEETTIAENRGSSQAILDYLKDPQNVTEKTLGGWHFYESRIIGLGASIEALEKNGNAEWITPKYPPTTPTSEQKKATLDKTELEAYVAIVTGAQPIDYFDTFVSEWKRLGGDAIAQEVQEYFAQ